MKEALSPFFPLIIILVLHIFYLEGKNGIKIRNGCEKYGQILGLGG